MTTTGVIFANVGRQLTDFANIAWPAGTALMQYLRLACEEIVNKVPEANTVTANLPLVAGVRQSIPADWVNLVKLTRNMGANGMFPGSAILPIEHNIIDSAVPDWNTYPPNVIIQLIVINKRDPNVFRVFPPQPPGTYQQVEALGSVYPTQPTDPFTGIFPLAPDYEAPATWYIVSACLGEQTTLPGAQAKSAAMLQRFYTSLGFGDTSWKELRAEQEM